VHWLETGCLQKIICPLEACGEEIKRCCQRTKEEKQKAEQSPWFR